MKKLYVPLVAAMTAMFLMLGTVLAFATVQTDQPDYTPGSIVTISGDNSNGAGYLAGEIIPVSVSGPNGYAATCEGVADENGTWSCQVTLWGSLDAVGTYTYAATGQTSGVSESGTFTDAITLGSFASNCNTASDTFTKGATVCAKATGLPGGGGGSSGKFEWWAPGDATPTRTTAFSGASGYLTDSYAPDVCGTWTLKIYSPAATLQASDTFAVTGCASATSLAVSDASGPYGGTTTLSATLTSGGSGVNDKTISFSLHGGGVVTATTNSSGVATLSGVSLSGINVGTYLASDSPPGVSASFASDGGYSSSSGTATLTVGKAATTTTVMCDAGPFTYDGSAHTPCSATVAGAGGLNQSLTVTYSDNTNAGQATASASYAESANYLGSSDTENFTIGKADATCTISGYTGVYDAASHGASGSCKGVNNVDLSAGLTLGATFTDVPGGTAHWTFTGGTNYNDQSGNVDITITKADATCTVTGYDVVLDGNAHTATGSCSGVGGVDLTSLLDLSGTTHTAAGDYLADPWTFAGNGNYKNQSGTVSDRIHYNWTGGFFQPVDNLPTWNSAKAGQAIPVKFSLGGNQGLSILKAGFPKATVIACPTGNATVDPLESYATGTANNGLIYDAASGQYNYVWKTEKAWAGKCFLFDLGLKDGTSHTFKVQFTK